MNAPPDARFEEAAWSAVVARDASQRGRFVYAVRSTGVFCGPGCPARRPLRENVRFFTSAAAARAEGYRACRRCRPDDAPGPDETFVKDAVLAVEAHPSGEVRLDDLAAALGLSPSHLARRLRARTGFSPRTLQRALRLTRFREAIRRGEDVSAAGYAAGFGSSRGLYEAAREGLGMTPGTVARGGAGAVIEATHHATALGRMLVASTARGVCAVLLGDEDRALDDELARAFPAATLRPATARHRRLATAAVGAVESLDAPLAVPLDLRGTPFQVKVWRALREIPAGETRSYAAVARALGDPRGARAVARACASNVVAVLVPCHRVVRADGRPSGYRWGARRKVLLLEREGEAAGSLPRGGRAV